MITTAPAKCPTHGEGVCNRSREAHLRLAAHAFDFAHYECGCKAPVAGVSGFVQSVRYGPGEHKQIERARESAIADVQGMKEGLAKLEPKCPVHGEGVCKGNLRSELETTHPIVLHFRCGCPQEQGSGDARNVEASQPLRATPSPDLPLFADVAGEICPDALLVGMPIQASQILIRNKQQEIAAILSCRFGPVVEASTKLAQTFSDGPCWCWESTRAKWIKDGVRHQSDCLEMKKALTDLEKKS